MCLAVPGRVVEIMREDDMLVGKVAFGEITKRVCLEHVSDVRCGEYVLVHVGFALAKLDEAAALRELEFLASLAELEP
jgi:hydrogenase expression/formation protein HypC